jgi:hypothetical protein
MCYKDFVHRGLFDLTSLQIPLASTIELVMSDQVDTESVSHDSILAMGVCSSADLEQCIQGSGRSSVEPNSTCASAPDGTFGEWDWQMLAHQQQYQEQQYLQQQQQIQQHEYQQQLPPQSRPQSFQHETDCQIADHSKNTAFGLSAPTPQVGVPWTQLVTQSGREQYGTQDLSYAPEAAIFGSEGQQIISLSDPSWSAPSATQSIPNMGSDYGAVKW